MDILEKLVMTFLLIALISFFAIMMTDNEASYVVKGIEVIAVFIGFIGMIVCVFIAIWR